MPSAEVVLSDFKRTELDDRLRLSAALTWPDGPSEIYFDVHGPADDLIRIARLYERPDPSRHARHLHQPGDLSRRQDQLRVCGKCGRFLLVAEVPGKLKEFTGTFDLDNFNRNRQLIVRGIVKRSHGGKVNANDREHLQFLTGHNAKLSVTTRLSGRISALNSRLRRR